jgi:hypothetical protein
MQRFTSFMADEVRLETVEPPEKTLMRRISPAVMAYQKLNVSFPALLCQTPRGATHAERCIEEGATELTPLPQHIEDVGA